MKIFAFLLLAACGTAEAQAQLRYGFRFGADIADVRLEGNSDRIINRTGFTGGLALEYQFAACGFAPDIAVVYTRRNARLSGLRTPQMTELESIGRNFIEIPIHLKYKFWMKSFHDLFAPMVYTGPSLSFRVGNDDRSDLEPKRFQPGWDVGIGFDIVNFIQITGGYRFGLGNAAGAMHVPDQLTLRTNSWNVSATFLFDF